LQHSNKIWLPNLMANIIIFTSITHKKRVDLKYLVSSVFMNFATFLGAISITCSGSRSLDPRWYSLWWTASLSHNKCLPDSVASLQKLQLSSVAFPMFLRWYLTGQCPVRVPVTVLSPDLLRESASFVHLLEWWRNSLVVYYSLIHINVNKFAFCLFLEMSVKRKLA